MLRIVQHTLNVVWFGFYFDADTYSCISWVWWREKCPAFWRLSSATWEIPLQAIMDFSEKRDSKDAADSMSNWQLVEPESRWHEWQYLSMERIINPRLLLVPVPLTVLLLPGLSTAYNQKLQKHKGRAILSPPKETVYMVHDFKLPWKLLNSWAKCLKEWLLCPSGTTLGVGLFF